jgi:peptide/nickel transport system permease protein
VSRFLVRRLLLLVPVLMGVSVIVFLVLHLAPGDPAEIMLGSQATQADRMRLRADLGLDEPLYLQYGRWMGHVVQGDLGRSLWMRRPVLGEVLTRLEATLLLTATALVISSIGGVALGILSATRPNSLLDRTSAVASLFGASMPVFWLGIVLMVLFSLVLRMAAAISWTSRNTSSCPRSRLPPRRSRSWRASRGPPCSTCWGRTSSARRARRGSSSAASSCVTR